MDRKYELRGSKLLNFKFQNGLEIVSGVGATVLKNTDKPTRQIRIRDTKSLSRRDHYLNLAEAARQLELYDKEVDDVLLDIARYRWGR